MSARKNSLPAKEMVVLLALLALGVGIRLVNITQPYLGSWSWKHGTNGMIAENFYRHGFNIFYPQINWAGSAPGYIGTEFPLVPFTAALLYVPFGVQEWVGRAISVVGFALSVPFLYLLIKEIWDERSALLATAIYTLLPLGIYAGRSFIPDTMSLGFSIIAIHLFKRWLERPAAPLFVAGGLAAALAILLKLPAVLIGVPLLYLAWEKYGARVLRRKELWAFAALCLIPPIAWYVHSWLVSVGYYPHQHAAEQPGVIDVQGYGAIVERTATSSLTPLAAAGMLAGIFFPPDGKSGRLFHWWLAAVVFYIFVAGNLNYRHAWYQLPILPAAAAFAGRAFDLGLRKLREATGSKSAEAAACAAIFIALAGLSYAYVKPLYHPWAIPLWKAGNEINRIAAPDALVIFADNGDPIGLYYSRHKGWHAMDTGRWGNPKNSAQAIAALEELRKQGASYLVFTRYTVWWLAFYKDFQTYLDIRYRRVRQSEDYVIFDLSVARGAA
jgi:4-amino-4-deoxy-L-arabinose transferase-like glycosyltransferase